MYDTAASTVAPGLLCQPFLNDWVCYFDQIMFSAAQSKVTAIHACCVREASLALIVMVALVSHWHVVIAPMSLGFVSLQ